MRRFGSRDSRAWLHEFATLRSKEATWIHQTFDTIMVINTNLGAMVSQRNLAESTKSLQRSLSRLATGSKIVQPQDDAAGLAMAARLDARLKRLGATQNGIANVISFTQTRDGYLSKVQQALERMSELTTLASDTTKSAADIGLYVAEFNNLRDTITAIAGKKFNGVNLFGAADANVFLDEDQTENFTLTKYNLAEEKLTKAAWAAAADAVASSGEVATALTNVSSKRAALGGDLSRLNISADTLSVLKENVAAATSRIRDVDVAEESASYAKYSILVQAGTAMLAQANVIPQTALRLLT